ncbi:MAG: flagellar protein FlgN [Pseudomonadota bacterium]
MNSLDACMHEEHQAALSLLTVLTQEQQSLVDADTDGLAALTAEKTKLVARMSALAHQRHRTLALAGFAASEAGMLAWLDNPAVQADGRETWRELLSVMRSAQELNRTNGLLINKQMARNQQALKVLQGGAQAGNFYGPNGQATITSVGRRLVVG